MTELTPTTIIPSLRERAIREYRDAEENKRRERDAREAAARQTSRDRFAAAVKAFAGVDGSNLKLIDYPDGQHYIETGGVRFGWDGGNLRVMLPCNSCGEGWSMGEPPRSLYELGLILSHTGTCADCWIGGGGEYATPTTTAISAVGLGVCWVTP